jgi:diguanylate cyclase (GGDEF)-like protein
MERPLPVKRLSSLGPPVVVALSTVVILIGAAIMIALGQATQLLFLFPPGLASVLVLRGYLKERRQREQLDLLLAALKETTGSSQLELAIQQLLGIARRLLHADYAELVILPLEPDEPLLVCTSGPRGDTLRRPERPTDADAAVLAVASRSPAAATFLEGTRGVAERILSDRGVRDAIVGAVAGEDRPIGALLVGDRRNDTHAYASEDLAVFATFAGHVSMVLENSRLGQSLEQLSELKEQLRHQAFHDALTGLPNRVLFTESVARALEGSGSPSVLFLDLDDFKLVNDTWGHAAGDELLVHAAERLRRAVRAEDMPARLGGDEFAVLLAEGQVSVAREAAQRISEAFDRPFSVHDRTLGVRPSIGIAVGKAGVTAEQLLRNADVAMYAAKADEDLQIAVYEAETHEAARRRRELALDLDSALSRFEIEVHFQPVVSLASGEIEAFEALVRWSHPAHGLMNPGDFLPIADNRQMAAIGKQVVAEACRHASLWQEAVGPVRGVGVWVNLSAIELTSDHLVQEIRGALERSCLDPHLLTVEITEQSVIKGEELAIRKLRDLRELGVRVAIDDFGTGYSSLSRLGEFPLDTLKIPQPFVDRLVDADADVSLVDAILRLAGSLGLGAVAEGVERDIQADILRDLGCGLAQGYLYAPALDADFVLRLLRSGITLPAPHGFRSSMPVGVPVREPQRRVA